MRVIRVLSNLIFIFFVLTSFSQSDTRKVNSLYVPYKYFKEYYMKKDSLGFRLLEKDTLVLVRKFIKPKGIGVPYEAKDSTFLEIYKSVAFQPIKKKNSNTSPMKYWKREIKIYFTSNISKKVKKELFNFSKIMDRAIDSLNITKVKNIENANYIVYTDNDFEYEENLKNVSTAGYYINWNKKNQITKGHIKLNTSNLFSDLLQFQKIKEQFILSLGWFKLNKNLDCTSYFSDCFSDKKKLNKLDFEILKYHYSYGICKGTTMSVFEEQHKLAKKALEKPHSQYIIYHQE